MNIRLCGGSAAFRAFLHQLGDCRTCTDAEEMLALGFEENLLCVLMPDYTAGERMMKEPCMTTLYGFLEWKKRGVRFYAENVPMLNYLAREVFSAFMTGNECHFNQDGILWDGELLQARNHYYYPAVLHGNRERTVLAEAGDFLGANTLVREPSKRFPVLFDDQEGCVTALMDISACQPVFMRPRSRWKHCLCNLWSGLTSASPEFTKQAFDTAWPECFAISRGTDVAEGLEKAMDWHRNCGLLPVSDGSEGIMEMFMSGDYSRRKNYRTDSILMTAALFAGYGTFSNKASDVALGNTLGNFLLDRGIQDADGFLYWYDHSKEVYANDSGRHGLSLLYLWRLTNNRRFLVCAQKLAKACLDWLKADGLYCGMFSAVDLYTKTLSQTPIFYGEMAAFLLCLGTEEAKNAVLRFAKLLDPYNKSMGHSQPDALSRALLLYSCVHLFGGEDCTALLSDILDYYQKLQNTCGGFQEDDLFPRTNIVEAAVAYGAGKDHIGDQLYCNNYLFLSLSLLRKGCFSGRLREQIEEMYQRVKAYLLHIQIASHDRRFNGAWMRAFNMDIGEYHGMANDADWGPYCIMTGWVMGYIPLVLLNDLGGPAFIQPLQ